MLQPRTYPKLIGKALVLDAEPFVTMTDDDNPWAEGLFLVASVGLAVGVAQTVGNLLMTASLPPSSAVLELLLNTWGQLSAATGFVPDPAPLENELRQAWELSSVAGGYSGSWSRLSALLWAPALLIVLWLVYGGLSHGIATLWGGTGRLSQTMGATALLVAPHVLRILTALPFVSVSNLLLTVWSLLIVYRAMEVAHDLPWRRALVVALAPLILLALSAVAFTTLLAGLLLAMGG